MEDKIEQPPLTGAKFSRVHSVPQASHCRFVPFTMWKLNDPHGSHVLTPATVLPEGVEIITNGKYSPFL